MRLVYASKSTIFTHFVLTIALVLALLLGSCARAQKNTIAQAEQQAESETQATHGHIRGVNFKLAQLFEQKAQTLLKSADLKTGLRDYQESWLYTLAATAQAFPAGKHLPDSSGRLVSSDLVNNAFRTLWRSQSASTFYKVAHL
jgi:hypothetical protein